ncbi:MAG TPA: AbrB family transcriptional regulator [Capillimicrobium sp.]|nr:AbrB family transcriptional regulator [Capillimicrobium sp.]
MAAATIALALAAGAIGLPSAALFAALLAGIGYALTLGGRAPLVLPPAGLLLGQAVVGVSLGTSLDGETLKAVGADALPIALATAATLVVSVGAGLVLSRVTGVDRATGTLGLVAGGASGIVALSDELGADARLVAFMQYLRVLVVVLFAPLVAYALLGHAGDAGAGTQAATPTRDPGLLADLAFTAGCAAAGLVAARLLRLTAGSLLMPLVIAAALTVGRVVADAQVPQLIEDVAFGLIGLQVGLRFTVATIREAGRLLPSVLASIFAMIAACAAMAAALVPLAGVSYASAYLATTPGGLYAVLAAAVGAGANTTFVLAVQALRLFAMILLAPPLVRVLAR